MRRIVTNKKGVSEVVGTILMLGMAIALFTIVHIAAINFPFNEPNPSVRISATIDYDDNVIIIVHQGGESLSPNTNIIVDINGKIDTKTAAEMLVPGDESWDIGEILLFKHKDYPDFSLIPNFEAKITVVDVVSNSVVMQGAVRG